MIRMLLHVIYLILSKRPTVKSGAMGDDQSVQNQMRQFTVTLLHTHHAIRYCAACTIILHLSACSIKLHVQALVIHVLAWITFRKHVPRTNTEKLKLWCTNQKYNMKQVKAVSLLWYSTFYKGKTYIYIYQNVNLVTANFECHKINFSSC